MAKKTNVKLVVLFILIAIIFVLSLTNLALFIKERQDNIDINRDLLKLKNLVYTNTAPSSSQIKAQGAENLGVAENLLSKSELVNLTKSFNHHVEVSRRDRLRLKDLTDSINALSTDQREMTQDIASLTITENLLKNCQSKLNCEVSNFTKFSSDHVDVSRTGCSKTKFKFPRKNQTSDWIRVKVPIQRISALTVCAWITPLTSAGITAGFISYSTWTNDNEFLVFINGLSSVSVSVRNEDQYHQISISTKYHLCVSVSAVEGWSKVHANGTFLSRRNFTSRQPIEGGGAFLIGQDQDEFMGSFNIEQAFAGTIENFMMWYRVLEDTDIKALYEDSCHCPNNYSISLAPDQIQIEGKVMSLPTEQCY